MLECDALGCKLKWKCVSKGRIAREDSSMSSYKAWGLLALFGGTVSILQHRTKPYLLRYEITPSPMSTDHNIKTICLTLCKSASDLPKQFWLNLLKDQDTGNWSPRLPQTFPQQFFSVVKHINLIIIHQISVPNLAHSYTFGPWSFLSIFDIMSSCCLATTYKLLKWPVFTIYAPITSCKQNQKMSFYIQKTWSYDIDEYDTNNQWTKITWFLNLPQYASFRYHDINIGSVNLKLKGNVH